AAAVLVLAIAGAIVFRRPTPVENPLPKPTPPTRTIAKTDRNPAAESTEVQLATARNLSDELGRRKLNAGERVGFSKAKALLQLAQGKFDAKDYQGGAQLAADAISGLQAVIDTNDRRMQKPSPQPQPHPQPQPPVPQPPVPLPPTPQPQPQPPVPSPQPPARESPEREIGAFMQRLATAYQSRAVEVFREHSLQFT